MNKVEEVKKEELTNDKVVAKKETSKKPTTKKKTATTTTKKATTKKATTKSASKAEESKSTEKGAKKQAKAQKVNEGDKKKVTKTTTKKPVKKADKVEDDNKAEKEQEKKTKTTKKTTTKKATEIKADDNKIDVLLENINTDTIIESNKDLKEEPVEKPETQEEIANKDETKKSSHKSRILVTIAFALLFIGLVVFSTIFGLTNRSSNKIVSGVSVKGIDVSGLTYEEAEEKIEKIYNEKLNKSILLKHGEYENYTNPEEIEASFGIKEALDMAYDIGRSGKVLKDNYAIINANIMKVDINPSFTYNEKALNDILDEISTNLPDAVQQSSYAINDSNLVISKGNKGYGVNKEELKTMILNNITNLNSESTTIEMPVQEQEPEKIDINKIHEEIHKEPKDAYFTKEPFAVYPHVDGVDFDISIEEAQALVNSEEKEVIIPLKITKPNVTTNQIGTEAFPDLLASYTTTFAASNVNRTTNIKLASNKINGVVLMPGEEFSYNKVVGKRTAAAGFKPAGAYVAGKVVNEIGGGICQVSSTLYNTALRSNLEIVKRSNHRFATGYVPLSTDATVSWGGPEFVFKNTRKYPIKIVSTVTGGKIKVDIFGCKEEVEYEVVIQSQTLQVIPMKTEYRKNAALPQGTTKTVQKGHPGYKSCAYRILKLNGSVVSKQLLSTDTYAQLSTIIETN